MNQILVLLITLAASQGPVWAPLWQSHFHEVNKEGVFKQTTTGTIYYDYANGQYRLDRENGRSDRYCGSTHAKNTPCSHYVKEGKRYLHFPNLGQCCYCCDSANGCGILKPDWAADAEYLGNVVDETGRTVEKWDKKGVQSNYIYQTTDSKINTQIDQVPNNFLYFELNSYRTQVDPSVFQLPNECSVANECSGLSICGRLRTTPKE